MRILYIEDNDINRFVFSKMLSDVAEISVASNGTDGLELLKDNIFDFVFLDLNLDDEMDGFDVLKEIDRLEYREKSDAKIIAITAYVSDDWQEKCRVAGFDNYIGKPVTPTGLRSIISVNSLN